MAFMWRRLRVELGLAWLLMMLAAPGMGLLASTNHLLAQDFLKQLEEKVREKLQESKKPDPNAESKQVPTQPPNETPSEESLPAPVRTPVPNPFLLPEKREPQAEPSVPSRAPYLGLIAEKIAGGRTGLRVVEVAEGSPAWKAGFRVNDRILAVDGFVVSDLDGLGSRLQAKSSGTPVKFLVNRDGRNRDITAVLLDPQIADQTQPSAIASEIPAVDGQPVLGVSVENLSENFRRRFGIVAFRGAAVTEVDPDSPASLAGIRPGDCIVEADGEIMQSAVDLQNWMLGRQAGQAVTLGVYRGRSLNRVQLVLGGSATGLSNNDGNIPTIDPTYTASLEAELQRVRQELDATKRRLNELEQRLQRFENR